MTTKAKTVKKTAMPKKGTKVKAMTKTPKSVLNMRKAVAAEVRKGAKRKSPEARLGLPEKSKSKGYGRKSEYNNRTGKGQVFGGGHQGGAE